MLTATAKDLLSIHGPIATLFGEGYEPRPEQLEMAAAVERTLAEKSHLLVEAGTGVGKSFAYLVPAMLRAMVHREVVLVATNTISLQEQLMSSDIPRLTHALESACEGLPEGAVAPIKPVLVKGRSNYVSVRRLGLASKRQDRLIADPAARRSLHVIEDWARSTDDGTLSTLPILERQSVWDKVQSDSGNCMGRKCPNFAQCFFQAARAELDGANLLVCNHALFFSDLALRAQDVGFLPRYHHVILDEAHAAEEVASDHFGAQLSESRVSFLLNSLYTQRSGKGYLPGLTLLGQETDATAHAIRLVEQAHHVSLLFFESVAKAARVLPESPFDDSRAKETSRVRSPGLINNTLTPIMRELALRLTGLKDSVKLEEDRFELNSYAQRAERIALDAEALISQSIPGCAYWVDAGTSDADSRQRINLACAPIDVAPILKEHLFARDFGVVLTSATLTTRTTRESESAEHAETAFAHTLTTLGCVGARTLQLGSPFDYATQVEVLIDPADEASPAASNSGRPAWRASVASLAQRILHHVKETDGGAFVLFTSLATLRACASELAGPLAELGLPLLAQGRDGSRAHILERFRESNRSVLFGAASFWQGVDVRGENLRNVIITKLPFDPPDRPIVEARGEAIRARGGNPFSEDSLPRALVRFKQGFGRLIRSKTDRGRVVILDGRVRTKSYGRLFLAALPPGVTPRFVDRRSDADDRGDGLDSF